MSSFLAFLISAGLLVTAGHAAQPASARVRGLTISTHGNGDDWASDRVAGALEDAKALGATWVAFHPYARIGNDGSVTPWQGRHNPEPIAKPIRAAHARGLSILIVPHLAQWGSQFRWRGEIAFQAPEQRARFFAEYQAWLTAVAEVGCDADALAVGSELDLTVAHEQEWRAVIASVRLKTKAALTYGANWTDYAAVPFWDALDAIGIQAYFPLVTEAVTRPTRADLEAGWQRHLRDIAAFAQRHDRFVVFTELGYNRSWRAASAPWEYGVDGPDAAPLQALCLDVALRAIEAEPRVVGAFLWKWFPPPRRSGRNFQLATAANMQVIENVWRPLPAPSVTQSPDAR